MIGKRLKETRIRAGMGQLDLAVAIGLESSSMISMIERGDRDMRLAFSEKAARVLGTSLDYLVGLSDDPRPYSALAKGLGKADESRSELGDGAGTASEVVPNLGPEEAAEYVEVHWVGAAAGGGALIEYTRVKGYLAFMRSWMESKHIDPEQCSVINVIGTWMAPTLPEGCLVLVDHRRLARRSGVIYALEDGDNLVVKRAGRSKGGGWEMLSDNPYWPPVPWPEGAVVKGEVRWMSRDIQ